MASPSPVHPFNLGFKWVWLGLSKSCLKYLEISVSLRVITPITVTQGNTPLILVLLMLMSFGFWRRTTSRGPGSSVEYPQWSQIFVLWGPFWFLETAKSHLVWNRVNSMDSQLGNTMFCIFKKWHQLLKIWIANLL